MPPHRVLQQREEADGGDDDNDFQFEVEMLVIDDDHQEKAPTITPADLSACVVFVSCFSYENNNIIQMYIPLPASRVQDSDSPLEAEPKKPKYYHIAFEILTTERTQVIIIIIKFLAMRKIIYVLQVCTRSMVFGKGK